LIRSASGASSSRSIARFSGRARTSGRAPCGQGRGTPARPTSAPGPTGIRRVGDQAELAIDDPPRRRLVERGERDDPIDPIEQLGSHHRLHLADEVRAGLVSVARAPDEPDRPRR